jgi:hypothetical protein
MVVGRPEKSLDPTAGSVQQFAAELREVRELAGRPTYRQLAAQAHYSSTVLSRAAAGKDLPSLAVTLAFVEACGGDCEAWTGRWQAARDACAAAGTADAASLDASEPGCEEIASPPVPPVGRARRRHVPRWAHGRRAIVAAVAAVSLAAAGVTYWSVSGQPGPGLDPTWRWNTQNVGSPAGGDAPPEPMDGDDPRARDCSFDATVLQTVPFYLPGTRARFGTLRLRHSKRCGADWASAYYANPHLYTVTLFAHRPADGAEVQSSWSNYTPPGSYGDMLSTASGCVWVAVTVITPAGTSRPVRTSCLR